MLDYARQFIERVLPWPVNGQGSYVNIHWSSKATHGGKFWDGRACTTPDEFIKALNFFSTHGDPKDIYVCMSSQAKMEEKTAKTGKKYNKALRLANDVAGLKSLFIDIDVKPGAYETTQDAIGALGGFITALGIPEPTAVVASGSGGFHAHWVLDRTLTRLEWQPLADALARAVIHHKLMADTQCTVDSARILRIPETLNHKTDPPNPVILLSLAEIDVSYDVMHRALEPFFGPVVAQLSSIGPGAGNENDVLGAGVTSKPQDISLDDVTRDCPLLARIEKTGGKDVKNDLWFLTSAVATFLTDGRAAFHKLSNQHAGYEPKATDELYDRVVAKQKQRDLGWPKCQKFAAYGNSPECVGCPLLVQNKSPLNFALVKKSVDTPDQILPERYVRSPEGIVSMRITDDNGAVSTSRICDYPMSHGWLSNAPWTLHFVTTLSARGKTTIQIPCEIITAKDTLGKHLGIVGFFCTETQVKTIKEFLLSWIQKLQKHKESVISSSAFGWSVVDGKIEGFSYAGRVWMDGDDRPAASPSIALTQQYSPRGTIEPWDELAKIIYQQDRPALNAILAVAFAAPLVHFTGFPGLIMNTYSSESGIGKTTAMKTSQAVWGNPMTAMQQLDDTSNSILGKMGLIKSLPVYWDEIKSEAQIKAFCSSVFKITSGKDKSRMATDTSLREVATWQTMLVSASNDSLVDGMAKEVGSTTAGLHRLFEFIVPPSGKLSRDIGSVQRLTGKLENNFGHAGLTYSKFLGKYYSRIETEVADCCDKLYLETDVKGEERMWIATIAIVIKGAEYANELGLTDINVPGLKKFLLGVLAGMRSEVSESSSDLSNDVSISSILSEFMKLHRARGTLYTNRINISRGKPPIGAIKVVKDATKLDQIQIQIGVTDRRMRISARSLTTFMIERNYSRKTFVDRLINEFGARDVQGILGSGTEYALPVDRLLEIDMDHGKFKNLIE